MLVIDENGIPQEFRCTLPLRPSFVQRTLYGEKLEPYIFVELMGARLMRALDTEPSYCLVERTDVLSLREHSKIPIFQVQSSIAVSTRIDSGQQYHNIRNINVRFGETQSLTVKHHPNYPFDFESVAEHLDSVAERIDIMEPFTRVSTSIGMLTHNDERFK